MEAMETENTKLKVTSVDFLLQPGGKKAYRVGLEGGIGYEWPAASLEKKEMSGLRVGSFVEICGRRGTAEADLWGANLLDVRLVRETVRLRITYCHVIVRPRDGKRVFVLTLENGAGFTWDENHLQAKGLPELREGDVLEVSGKTGNTAADLWGWNSLFSVRHVPPE